MAMSITMTGTSPIERLKRRTMNRLWFSIQGFLFLVELYVGPNLSRYSMEFMNPLTIVR